MINIVKNTAGKALANLGATLQAASGPVEAAIGDLAALDDMARRTGASVEGLSRLKKVADAFGGDMGEVENAVTGLAQGIAEVDGQANSTYKALAALGLSARETGGKLRDPALLMADAAKQLANYSDGAGKAALVNDLFKTSGEKLLPYLRDLGAHYDKVSGDSARAAASAALFQDQIGLAKVRLGEIATEVASAGLPALTDLGGAFHDVYGVGSKLTGVDIGGWADEIALALAGVADVAIQIARVFTAVSGSFKVVAADLKVLSTVAENANPVTLAMKIAKGANPLADVEKAIAARQQVLEQANQNYDKLFNSPLDPVTQAYLERRAARNKVPPAPKPALMYAPADKDGGTPKQEVEDHKKVTQALIDRAGATTQLNEATRRAREAAELHARALAGARGDLQGIQEQVKAQRKANEEIGLSAEALADLTLKRLEDAAVAKDLDAAAEEARERGSSLAQSYRDQAVALRELVEAKRAGAVKQKQADEDKKAAEAARKAQEEWKQAAEEIEKSLTKALRGGFDSVKAYGKELIEKLKSSFDSLVLQPTIKAAVQPVAGVLNSFLGGLGGKPNSAAAGGGGSDGAYSLGLQMYGAMSSMGSYALTGFMNTVAGSGLSTGLSAAGSMIANGSVSSGISMGAGAIAPYALAIAAAYQVWKSLDTSGTYHTGGAASATGDAITTIRAETLNFEKTRTNAQTEEFVGQLAAGVVKILDSTALAFGKSAGYTAATAFADDTSKDGAWGGLVISKGGDKLIDWQDTRTGKWAPKTFADGEAGRQQYLDEVSKSVRTALDGIGLPSWAQSMLDKLGQGASLEEMAKVIESINSTQTALKQMREQLVGFADLSDATVAALMKAAGGIEALASGATAYYDNFYSDAEKSASVSKQIAETLKAVGLAVPATREAFRALVEQQLGLGESGAAAVAALFKVAGAFAQLHPVLEAAESAAGKTAAELAVLNKGYQDQIDALLQARMTPEELRTLETKGMDASTLALYERLKALQHEDQVLQERTSLQEEYDALSMNSAELLARQREGLDESNRALFDNIQAIKAHAAQMGEVDNAFTVLQRVVGREKERLQDEIERAGKAVGKLQSLSDALHGAFDSLRSPEQLAADRDSARAEIAAALAIARAGGPLPQLEHLERALADLGRGAEPGSYATYEEYQRELLATQADLKALADLTDGALSVEQKHLQALEKQVERYDQMLQREQEQIDALKGIADTGLSIRQALETLHAALVKAGAPAPASPSASIREAYEELLGRAPDAAGLQFWQNQAAQGMSQADIRNAIGASPEAQIQKLYKEVLGHPADPAGLKFWLGQVGAGVSLAEVRAALERSDEAVAQSGRRAMSKGQARSVAPAPDSGPVIATADGGELTRRLAGPSESTAELASAVERLTREVEGLRVEARASATHAEASARLLGRVVSEDVINVRMETE